MIGRMPEEKEFEALNTEGYIEPGKKKAKKNIKFALTGLGFKAVDYTDSGWPAVSQNVFEMLAGNPKEGRFGDALKHFPREEDGKRACFAIDALCQSNLIKQLLTTFILPLQVVHSDEAHASDTLVPST